MSGAICEKLAIPMHFRQFLPVAALALSSLTIAPLAHAETPPDVVMLKNGGMLRGTIEEMDPQGNVVIELASGEKRTFPMSDVKYAGMASGAPGAETAPAPAPAPPAYAPPPVAVPPVPPPGGHAGSQPLVTVHGTEARLELRGEGVTFHREAGTGTGAGYVNGHAVAISTTMYETMCTAPCTVSVPRGTYTLALSKGGLPVEAEPVTVTQDGTLVGSYESKSGVRTTGLAVGIPLTVIGGSVMLGSLTLVEDPLVPMIAGGTIMTVGLVLLLTLVSRRDKAEIRFIPGAPVSLTHPSDLRADSGTRTRGFDPGLSLAMTF
ncbi:MAG: hypothetical protein R3B07_34035 [Polyangiaceae bacterium]